MESTPLISRLGENSRAVSRWPKSLRWTVPTGIFTFVAVCLLTAPHDQAAVQEEKPFTVPQTATLYREYFAMLNDSMNASVDPCDDFYLHACGNWLDTHAPAPGAGYNNAGISPIDDETAKIVQSIFDAQPPVVGEFYASCIATHHEIDDEGVRFVADLIQTIRAQNSTLALLTHAGTFFKTLGISTFFTIDVIADPSDPDRNVLSVAQGGLTLPSREYYLEQQKRDQFMPLLLQYLDDLAGVAAFQHFNWTGFGSSVIATETALAKVAAPTADLRDPWNSYTSMRLARIEDLSPSLAGYVRALSVNDAVVVRIPRVFADLNTVFSSLDVEQVKHFLTFHVIDAYADYLGESIRRLRHRLRGSFRGTELVEHDAFCRETVSTTLATQIGEYYMTETFTAETRTAAEELVAEINEAMAQLLPSQTWLDNTTLRAAQKKLHHLRNLLGGPTVQASSLIALSRTAFFANVVELKRSSTAEKLRQVGEPVDHTQWTTLKATDCDCDYIPSQNTIVYPAANWRPPMFSATSYPAVANYARIGMLIGHEVSHGYDDMGRHFDETGIRRDWWSVSAASAFQTRAQCLMDQYAQLPVVVDGETLGTTKGDLTLGENIADNGGIRLAYAAYQSHKRKTGINANDDRLFFQSFAQSWCETITREYAEVLRERNQHAMSQWRVNGPLRNFDKFADAYQCERGSRMHPDKKCVVWG